MARHWKVLFLYFFIGIALFGFFLTNPFLMDDELQITGNAYVQNLQQWPIYFTSSTMSGGGAQSMGGIYYKPLMTLYYAAIWSVAGSTPFAYRLPLLLLHILNSFLLFLFLQQLLATKKMLGPFLAALLFLVHPANSEVVAYIADAQDVLYLFFGLLALLSMRLKAYRWLPLGILLLCSLLSKETGVLFLFLAPLYAFFFQRGLLRPTSICALVVGIIYALLRWNAGLTTYEHPTLLLQQASLLERWQTVPIILWHYIEIFFFPWRISLTTDFVVNDLAWNNFWLPLAGVLLTGSGFFFLRKRCKGTKEKNVFYFALISMLLWLGLHSNIIFPLDGTYADRWLYFNFIALFSFTLLAIPERVLSQKSFIFSVLTIALCFSARTWIRLEDWRVPLQLYKRELSLHPQNAIMANNIGVELFRAGEISQAKPYFLMATENNPLWEVGWNNLGAVAQRQGQAQQALSLYAKSASLGSYHLAYENYASLLCSLYPESEDCRNFVQGALKLFPHNPILQQIANRLKLLEQK